MPTEKPYLNKNNIFVARTLGFKHYRIPTLILSRKGTLLAFAEARKGDGTDWDPISIVMRRSTDLGKTWEDMRVIVPDSDKKPSHNMVAIADQTMDRIHFIYCVNYEQAFYMRSDDEGLTFSKPVEITDTFRKFQPEYAWKVIAAGPGHGLQLKNGRLVVPVWMSLKTGDNGHRPSEVSCIYSDDGGETWERGDIVPRTIKNPNETTLVQLNDGTLLFNMRNENSDTDGRRAVTMSKDGAHNWTAPRLDPQLLDPCCFGSLVRYDENNVLFSNPNVLEGCHFNHLVYKDRKRLTVKLSRDDCQTWTDGRILEEGISGYSDMQVTKDGRIFCLYERDGINGNQYDNAYMCIAEFNLAWVTEEEK